MKSVSSIITENKTLNHLPFFLAAAEDLIKTSVSALTARGCAVTKSSIIAVSSDPALLALLLVDSAPIPARSPAEAQGVMRTIEILFAKVSSTEALAA